MSDFKIITLIIGLYFAYFGTWPFAAAVHGDGSTTTAIDYAFHIVGGLCALYVILRVVADFIDDMKNLP